MEEEKENVPFEPKSRGRLEALTLNDHMRYTIPKYTKFVKAGLLHKELRFFCFEKVLKNSQLFYATVLT